MHTYSKNRISLEMHGFKVEGFYWFPSPCGVLVLKFHPVHERIFVQSFRPLAGFWFLNACTAYKQGRRD